MDDVVDDQDQCKNMKIKNSNNIDHEYIQIKLSEAIISHFMGIRRRFSIKLNEEISEDLVEEFEFELAACFQPNPDLCYPQCVRNPLDVLKKLPGIICAFGSYFWYFCVGFYQWALTQRTDQIIRYTGECAFWLVNY